MNLYKKIEQLCRDRGITITDMCKESGASRGSLGDLKSGKKKILSVETLLKISNYFGLTINELISENNHRLLVARRISHKTREETANHLGIDLATYNHYENCSNAPQHVLEQLAVFHNVDLEFISGFEYVLDLPVSSWAEDKKEDYNSASKEEKIVMEYRIGKPRYLSSNTSGFTFNKALSPDIYKMMDQLTLKDLGEIKAIMEEKIKNRR